MEVLEHDNWNERTDPLAYGGRQSEQEQLGSAPISLVGNDKPWVHLYESPNSEVTPTRGDFRTGECRNVVTLHGVKYEGNWDGPQHCDSGVE